MKDKKIKIMIEYRGGSPFQEKFALDSLCNILKAWQLYLQTSHKNNRVDFSMEIDEPKAKKNV